MFSKRFRSCSMESSFVRLPGKCSYALASYHLGDTPWLVGRSQNSAAWAKPALVVHGALSFLTHMLNQTCFIVLTSVLNFRQYGGKLLTVVWVLPSDGFCSSWSSKTDTEFNSPQVRRERSWLLGILKVFWDEFCPPGWSGKGSGKYDVSCHIDMQMRWYGRKELAVPLTASLP